MKLRVLFLCATNGVQSPIAEALLVAMDPEHFEAFSAGIERGYYNQVALSPDRTHVTLVKMDPLKGATDVCVFDLATGKGTAITSTKREEPARTPVVAGWKADRIHHIPERYGGDLSKTVQW